MFMFYQVPFSSGSREKRFRFLLLFFCPHRRALLVRGELLISFSLQKKMFNLFSLLS